MSEEGSVGIVETQFFTFAESPNEMELDCGRRVGPVTLAYETYGELNRDRTNAILIVHALSGDAHAAGYHASADRKPGWWDSMIGPGKAFDTTKYFVICSNCLGGCQGSTGPSSLDPVTGRPYGMSFPIVTIGDMVRAQRQLLDHLEIESLLSVAGGSMGGMQVLEWTTRYPEMVRSSMVIASTAVQSAQAIAFDAVGRHAIQVDPAFAEGDYYPERDQPFQGLSVARMLAHITYLSDESMRAKFGRTLREAEDYSYDFDSEFSVETYLDYQGEQFVNRFDANSYLYITKALNYFDLTRAYGSLDEAMERVQGKTLVLSYSSDWLFPPYQSEAIVHSLMRRKRNVTYCNIQSAYGHDAFLLEVDVMRKIIGGYLDHTYREHRLERQLRVEVDSEADLGPPTALSQSIYDSHRVDYDLICNLVDTGSRVLDVGCGDGELLERLIVENQVDGMGIEVSQGNVVSCVRRGISVVQADVNDGLEALPDQSYDYVILSMTLQVIRKTELVLSEMLRVGRKCIISFPNFGFWKVRGKLLLSGQAPITRNLPYSWHTSPNRHVLSIKDFRHYCTNHNIRIERELPLTSRGAAWAAPLWPNLFADEAVFVITRSEE
ncbi:MAG: homoserine O-acetyltransferase [bacterium]|nr:homoserine O-acetyltransferase [bacterium]